MAVTSVFAHTLKVDELIQVFDDIYVIEKISPLFESGYLSIRASRVVPWDEHINTRPDTLRLMLSRDTKVHLWSY